MAVPKRRHSRQRQATRRANWKASAAPTRIACPHCGQAKRPHRICLNCGHYKGEEVLLVKEK